MEDKDIRVRKKRKKRKKKKLFKKVFFIYLGILTAICLIVIGVLWRFLANYQKKLDIAEEEKQHAIAVERAPQLKYDEYISGLTCDDWASIWCNNFAVGGEDHEAVMTVVSENFTGDYESFKADEYTREAPVYLLTKGGKDLAKVYLEGSELDWNIANTEILFGDEYSIEAQALDGCDLYCNGQLISEDYIVDTVSYYAPKYYGDKLNNQVKWNVYSIPGQVGESNITYENNTELDYIIDTDNLPYYVISGDDAKEFEDRAEELVRAVVRLYMMARVDNEAHAQAVIRCLAPDSEAVNFIQLAKTGVRDRHAVTDYKATIEVKDTIKWADNCYSVDVYHQAAGSSTSVVNIDDGTYRVFFHDMGDGFKIYWFTVKY